MIIAWFIMDFYYGLILKFDIGRALIRISSHVFLYEAVKCIWCIKILPYTVISVIILIFILSILRCQVQSD